MATSFRNRDNSCDGNAAMWVKHLFNRLKLHKELAPL